MKLDKVMAYAKAHSKIFQNGDTQEARKQFAKCSAVVQGTQEKLLNVLTIKQIAELFESINDRTVVENWILDGDYPNGFNPKYTTQIKEKREFYIATVFGKIKVYSKHDADCTENFPGVFIDIITDKEDIPLACVEYESVDGVIQTCVYGDVFDDAPTAVIKHNINGKMES